MLPRPDTQHPDATFPSLPMPKWSQTYGRGSLMMTLVLSDEMCRRNQLHDIAQHLCDESVVSTNAARIACSDANTNFIKADDCSDEAVNTMILCGNVCTDGGRLLDLLYRWSSPGKFIFVGIVCFRLIKILQQLYAVFKFHHMRSKHPIHTLINELALGDNFESDDDEAVHDCDSGSGSERECGADCNMSHRTPRASADWCCCHEYETLT